MDWHNFPDNFENAFLSRGERFKRESLKTMEFQSIFEDKTYEQYEITKNKYK